MPTSALQHYKFEAHPELANIIDEPVTFAVLKKIVNFPCTDIVTNGKSFVVCYSNAPFPIWVWCKRPYDESDTKVIADILKVEFLDKGDYRLIISEDLLEKLAKTHHVFAKMQEKMHLLSYELHTINSINYPCDGCMRKATTNDLETVTTMYKDACMEMEEHDFSIEQCKEKMIDMIANGNLFVWINSNDKIIATTSKAADGNYAKIAFVYTLPSERRKGYAINLVHGVTQTLLDEGLTPTLYTDGSYVASNECYKKIGYVQIGKLVNVEKGE